MGSTQYSKDELLVLVAIKQTPTPTMATRMANDKDELMEVIPISEEEFTTIIAELDNPAPPQGVSSECECLYEYNPNQWDSTVNINNCCTHCAWLYTNQCK